MNEIKVKSFDIELNDFLARVALKKRRRKVRIEELVTSAAQFGAPAEDVVDDDALDGQQRSVGWVGIDVVRHVVRRERHQHAVHQQHDDRCHVARLQRTGCPGDGRQLGDSHPDPFRRHDEHHFTSEAIGNRSHVRFGYNSR